MELTNLLEQARMAAPEHRIEWRDPIAAHGAPAIAAIQPWLMDDVLGAFAVRVIERIGINGDADAASRALRAARTRVAPALRGDVDWALQRVKVASRPQAAEAARPATTKPPVAPRRRERPRYPTGTPQRTQ